MRPQAELDATVLMLEVEWTLLCYPAIERLLRRTGSTVRLWSGRRIRRGHEPGWLIIDGKPFYSAAWLEL